MTDTAIDWEALSASFENEYAAAWQGIVDRSRAGRTGRKRSGGWQMSPAFGFPMV